MALRSQFPTVSESRIEATFLEDLSEYKHTKPYYISGILPKEPESSRTNIVYRKIQDIPLFDLRGEEHKLTIAKHGFQIIDVPEDIMSLDVRGSQKQEYIHRMVEYVKQLLNASFILCYDCRVSTISPITCLLRWYCS